MASTCPTCKKSVESQEPPAKSFPFCSSRCKMVDLGNWFAGEYVLSRPLDPEQDSEAVEEFIRAAEEREAARMNSE